MTRTKIEWATDTWNPVTGCTKVSEGCRNCYAERQVQRFGTRVHGLHKSPKFKEDVDRICAPPKFTHVICHPDKLDHPEHWRKRRRVFVCSMSDLFHGGVPDEFLHLVFDAMARATAHDFLVLTKRPERMRDFVVAANRPLGGGAGWSFGGPFPLPNVWLGVSVENQATADERIPLLLQTPAAVRFVSCEPMLGPIDLTNVGSATRTSSRLALNALTGHLERPCYDRSQRIDTGKGSTSLDWVICGGESGPSARPMHPDWARLLRDQCQAAGVPFFFKQWGEWAPSYDRDRDDPDWRNVPAESSRRKLLNVAGGCGFHGERVVGFLRVGKKAAGRELDGRTHDEVPGGAPDAG